MNWEVFGHERIKNVLNKQLDAGVFPHAYLFMGEEGVGKKLLAMEFATKVQPNKASINVVEISPGFFVEETRELMRSLSLRPMSPGYAVTIIDGIENLNTHSANSLLKTLEEPASSAIIILISSSRAVLPTILSRCQVFHFSKFSKTKLEEFAQIHNLKLQANSLLYAQGSSGKLFQLCNDADFYDEFEKHAKLWSELSGQSLGQRLLYVKDLSEESETSLSRLISLWIDLALEKMSNKGTEYLSWVKVAMEEQNKLSTNVNKKFIIERLLLSLPKTL